MGKKRYPQDKKDDDKIDELFVKIQMLTQRVIHIQEQLSAHDSSVFDAVTELNKRLPKPVNMSDDMDSLAKEHGQLVQSISAAEQALSASQMRHTINRDLDNKLHKRIPRLNKRIDALKNEVRDLIDRKVKSLEVRDNGFSKYISDLRKRVISLEVERSTQYGLKDADGKLRVAITSQKDATEALNRIVDTNNTALNNLIERVSKLETVANSPGIEYKDGKIVMTTADSRIRELYAMLGTLERRVDEHSRQFERQTSKELSIKPGESNVITSDEARRLNTRIDMMRDNLITLSKDVHGRVENPHVVHTPEGKVHNFDYEPGLAASTTTAMRLCTEKTDELDREISAISDSLKAAHNNRKSMSRYLADLRAKIEKLDGRVDGIQDTNRKKIVDLADNLEVLKREITGKPWGELHTRDPQVNIAERITEIENAITRPMDSNTLNPRSIRQDIDNLRFDVTGKSWEQLAERKADKVTHTSKEEPTVLNSNCDHEWEESKLPGPNPYKRCTKCRLEVPVTVNSDTYGQDVEDIRDSIGRLNESVFKLQDKNSGLDKDHDNLRITVNRLSDALTALEKRIDTLADGCTGVQENVAALSDDDKFDFKKEIELTTNSIELLRKDVNSLKKEITDSPWADLHKSDSLRTIAKRVTMLEKDKDTKPDFIFERLKELEKKCVGLERDDTAMYNMLNDKINDLKQALTEKPWDEIRRQSVIEDKWTRKPADNKE